MKGQLRSPMDSKHLLGADQESLMVPPRNTVLYSPSMRLVLVEVLLVLTNTICLLFDHWLVLFCRDYLRVN